MFQSFMGKSKDMEHPNLSVSKSSLEMQTPCLPHHSSDGDGQGTFMGTKFSPPSEIQPKVVSLPTNHIPSPSVPNVSLQLQEPEGNGTPSSKEENHGSLKEGSEDIEEADHDCVDDSISNADSGTDDKNGDEEKSPSVAGDGDTAMHKSGGPSPAVKATDDVQSTEAKETESMKANATEAGKEPATKAGKAPIPEVGKANATEAVKGNATEEGKGNVLEVGKGNTTEAAKPEKPKAPSTESGKPKATKDKKVAKKKINVPVKKARVSRKDA